MPRRFLRRLLPSHDTVRNNRYVNRFGPWLQHHNLWHLHRTAVAGGVAVGLFAGLVPGSNPVQFTAAALLAVVFRVNLPIAMIVTLYSNPFTVLPLYYLAFRLGQFVLLEPGGGLPALELHIGERGWTGAAALVLDWLATAGKPLLAGLPLLALLLALIGYFVTDRIWQLHVRLSWWQRSRQRSRSKNK